MDLRFSLVAWLLAVCFFAPGAGAVEKTADNRVVKDGQMVSLHYTLKGTDGKVIESSKNKEPLSTFMGRR